MAIRREWLDWNKPCIPQAAAWLIDRAGSSTSIQGDRPSHFSDRARPPKLDAIQSLPVCDLQSLMCVLPGQRAGRLLMEALLAEAAHRNLQLIPPRIMTPGSLLADVTAALPVASETESTFAWMRALQEADHDAIASLLPRVPEPDDVLSWYELAVMLSRVHSELAGGMVSIKEAAQHAEASCSEREGQRWRAVEVLHKRYRSILQEHSALDRHEAVMVALQNPASLQVVLIAVPELNALQRQVIAASPCEAVALVHAPEHLQDRFDSFGCVDAERVGGWKDAIIELDREPLIAERPEDQAAMALRSIAEFDGKYSASEIAIGVGDEHEGTQALERVARWAEIAVHSPIGTPLTHTAPSRLLQIVAEWLTEPRFATFAAMLRHPDLECWLLQQPTLRADAAAANQTINEWLSLLDTYFDAHLHERLTGEWLCEGERRDRLKALYQAVHHLLEPLASGAKKSRPLTAWSAAILEVLANVYRAHETLSAVTRAACLQWREALAALDHVADTLQPSVDAAMAIRWLLAHLQGEETSIADEFDINQIEMLGWLELHLDTAPALVITGFNEGCVPREGAHDPFLPDSLRSALGLPNRVQRYARDAYLLEAIRHSRESLSIILGKRTGDGDPLAPSRLLLACDGERLVQRVEGMCDDKASRLVEVQFAASPQPGAQSRFEIPKLLGIGPPSAMNVTDFKAYIDCPYRYALSRLLKLEGVEEPAFELSHAAFGVLAHEVLCDFGTDEEIRHSTNAEAIERYLLSALKKRSRTMFGRSPLPAVHVQVANLEERLKAFARFQAAHRNSGWAVHLCEHRFSQIPLDVDGQPPMPLYGKIDRVDQRGDDEWLILDYKTSNSPKKPSEMRTRNGEWKDLQLPLYDFLSRRGNISITAASSVQLGYIGLSADLDGESLLTCAWDATVIESGVQEAREIVKRIRASEFRPKEVKHDNFPRICQTAVLRGSADSGDDDGGDE